MMRSLTPLLSILISILITMFFIEPQYKEVTHLQEEISEYKVAAEQYAKFDSTLEAKLLKKNNRPLIDIERLNLFVPEKIDDTHALVELEALAEQEGMLFGGVRIDGGNAEFKSTPSSERDAGEDEFSEQPVLEEETNTTRNKLDVINVSFTTIGTYEQFKSFLRRIEGSLTLYEVVRIAFVSSGGMFQQFNVVVRTYALPNK